jgi:hypothetical protein
MTMSTIGTLGRLWGLGDYLQEEGALALTTSKIEYPAELRLQLRQAAPESFELPAAVIEHHLIALATRVVVIPAMGWLEHLAQEQDRKELRSKKARRRRVIQKIKREMRAKSR